MIMEDHKELWLGIDLGTTSAKAVLLNSCGNAVAFDSCPTLADIDSDIGDKGYEQRPIKILQAVSNLVISLIKDHKSKIKGIGVTGQMHGVVFWSTSHNEISNINQVDKVPSSNLYTWQDQRCSDQFLDSLPKTKPPVSTGFGCATIYWLAKHHPHFFKIDLFTCCGTIMDFLVTLVCGLAHPVTSDQLAASFGYFDEDSCFWSPVLQNSKEFPFHLLPKVVQAGEQVGLVSNCLEGWPSGVPVYVAMGDVQCAMFNALRSAHHAVVNISTSIQLGFVVSGKDDLRENFPGSITFFPYFKGQWLALFAGLNGGNVIQHFVECLAQWMQDLGVKEIPCTAAFLSKLQIMAEKDKPPGPSMLPVFFGERHQPEMTGQITRISASNFASIGSLFRAASEGIVDHLHDMVPAKFLTRMGIHSLTISGSVPVSNSMVKQRLMQVYSELEVSMECDGQEAISSAVGAARFLLLSR